MLHLIATQKDIRDITKLHDERDATVSRIEKLMNEAHRTNHGHSYDFKDDDEGCATCERGNVMARIDDEAPSFLDAYEDYLAHKV